MLWTCVHEHAVDSRAGLGTRAEALGSRNISVGFCPISSSRPLLMGHVIFLNSPAAAAATTTTTTFSSSDVQFTVE